MLGWSAAVPPAAQIVEGSQTVTDAASALEIAIHPDGDAKAVVVIAGDLDISSAPALRERLSSILDSGVRTVVVDMGRVTFIDSTGIGVLIGAHKQAGLQWGSVVITSVPPAIARALDVAGVFDRFGRAVE